MSDTASSVNDFLERAITLLEKHLSWLSLLCFSIGIFWADQSSQFAFLISDLMEHFIDGYSYFAPIAIYLILTPTLLKLFSSKSKNKSFAVYTIFWFAKARLIACLYAVVATVIIFDLPLYSGVEGFWNAAQTSFTSLLWMLTHSVYFYAVYLSIATVLIVLRMPRLANTLAKGVDIVEYFGRWLILVIPFMMLAVGAYVTILPHILTEALSSDIPIAKLAEISLFGINFDISDSLGMILIYILGALLTGVVCALWHGGLLIMARRKMPNFSLRAYFSEYWIKVYPLLWATSSEALATPLNLYMVKKFCTTVHDEVRQFVVGTGSFLNINGTIINVFLMTGLVAAILGIEISMLQLLLSIPIVFLIAYGIPGIPGELLIFGAPMALCMNISPEVTPVFLALYLGLQIGLPDSFRTAANSTDECLCAIILNDHYHAAHAAKVNLVTT